MSKPLKPRRGTTAEQNAFVGEAYEITYDTDKNTLVCRDGVTPGGFPLARADEVAAKDAAQDAELAKYLPLTGGKMQGNLAPSSLYANNPAGEVTFGVGTTWNDSPSLSLYGSNVNGPNAGSFILRAGNQTYDLFGNGNGDLRWGVKNIVRSVNGVNADASGDVTIVDTWTDGKGWWFRRWSDGWIEQGGQCAGASTSSGETVTFPLAFSNDLYSFIATPKGDTNSNAHSVKVVSHMATGVKVVTVWVSGSSAGSSSGYATFTYRWYACGY